MVPVFDKETRGYVPTFYATLVIATDPAAYGFRLGNDDGSDFKRVELEGPLSLKYLASVANVNEDVLRDLNPAYRRGVLPPGRATVRVPSKSADAVIAHASSLKNDDRRSFLGSTVPTSLSSRNRASPRPVHTLSRSSD